MKKIIVILVFLILLTVGCIETEIKKGEIYPTFEILASADTASYNPCVTFDSKENKFTIPMISWSNSHIIRDADGNSWVNPRLEFQISLNPAINAKTGDRETIYFSIHNLDERVKGLYRLLTKSDGWYRATWKYESENTWYEEGSKTLDVLGTYTITLDLDVNIVGASYMNYMTEIVLPVVFKNVDNTWSESFNISFLMVESRAM